MKYTTINVAALPLAVAMATASYAQTFEPAAVYVGAFDVTPTVKVNVQEDDNIFLQVSGSETSSTVTIVQPAFSAVADDGVTRYRVSYELEDGTYDDTVNSDYTDHQLSAGFDWRIDVRNLLELKTNYRRDHDDRSADSVTSLGAADLNEYKDRDFSAGYTYGAPESRGRISVNYRTQNLDYTTNLADTSVLESDSDTVDGSFSVAVGAVTRVVAQVVERSTDFPNDSVQNRDDSSFFVGADWEVTGLTSGSVRVGQTDSDLVNASGNDSSSTTGSVSISWAPYEYSKWTLLSSQSVENSENDVGSFVDRASLGVSLDHQWSDTFSMNVSITQRDDDFVGANRSDESLASQIGFNYVIRRWVTVGLSFSQVDKDSSDAAFTYDRNITRLSFSASL